MRYQAALRPDLITAIAASRHLGSRAVQGKVQAGGQMVRRRRKSRRWGWRRWALLAVAAIPALYLLAALFGSLIPVNRGWVEPDQGVTVYLADNGVHADIIMPAVAQGLDWR